jgi:prepilin-type N-terminal cleavage/methylation domain-containing protein
MNAQKQQKGFTIIEVVLVLAIAALIFLMIFVALPALQRGQANSARKSDAATVAAALNTFRTNKNGSLPTNFAALDPYIDNLAQLEVDQDSFRGTAADSAPAIITDQGTLEDELDHAMIYLGAKCDPGKTGTVDGSAKQAAVVAVVETGAGQFDTVCSDS